MENFQVYRDIQARTGGDIYIGVVGPVRTGKSTFIRRFMELVALPAISEGKKAELQDELPLSGAGKMITTVEPKFIPKEAVEVSIGENQKIRVKLIDCVGFLVKDASGNVEEGRERMVKTPWQEKAIPFHDAARLHLRRCQQLHRTKRPSGSQLSHRFSEKTGNRNVPLQNRNPCQDRRKHHRLFQNGRAVRRQESRTVLLLQPDPESVQIEQESCWLTYTNEKTHEIIRENLDRSPLYSGMIEGTGPRYCPSIEDKVSPFCR